MFRFAGFELDPLRVELRGPDGGAIKLRPKTFEMLRLFVANAGRVLSKQELMEAIWPNVHVGEDSLFQCIRELRAALRDDKRQLIRVVSGRGYRFDAEVSEVAVPAIRDEATNGQPADARPETTTAPETNGEPAKRRLDSSIRRSAAVAAVAGLVIAGLVIAAPALRPGRIFARGPATIAVTPLVTPLGTALGDAASDPLAAQMAASVTGRLADGLAKIENIRVVIPSTSAPRPDFVVSGELQKSEQSWTIRARMTGTATSEVMWTASSSVNLADGADLPLQQSRLAAGLGHALALRINALLNSDPPSAAGSALAGNSKVVIEQATAHINQTTPERFRAAQAMLETALASDPDNVELGVALAAHLVRGVQMVWYGADESGAVERRAQSILEHALRLKPNSVPVYEAYCRFLTTINQFGASLVACARTLTFDPWNGIALYHTGLAQLQLGRFEDALATFRQADRFDTPLVSRWTWLVGAGWASMLMGRAEDAVPWLQRSIAITPASGRPLMLLAAAYQQLGRATEANAAMTNALKLRPGSTARNVAPPTRNTSPVYLEASHRLIQIMVAAGLPEG
ncbi:MAG: winged helix-turn-helix domain-containing protein [Xanthobacteraceae bacterium]|nr:winged helix-turn-helix domain-containing protein [Xanthobacteraceae bacterium]